MKTQIFSTGFVANLCNVAPRTVSKWFDTGRLKGYRIPGSQVRRIPREYLIKFLKEHGMPLGNLEDEGSVKVLIVSQDQILIENLKRALPAENEFTIAIVTSGFEAGIAVESCQPDCILIDFSIGTAEATHMYRNLRRKAEFEKTMLIALLPDDMNLSSFALSTLDEAFKKPLDVRLLAERLRTLIGMKKEIF